MAVPRRASDGSTVFVGSVIKLNPIVWFDEAGRMISYDKTRTFKVAKDHMRQLVAEAGKNGVEAATLHWPDNLEEAQDFHAQMEEILQVPVSYTKLSCVLGVHTGLIFLDLYRHESMSEALVQTDQKRVRQCRFAEQSVMFQVQSQPGDRWPSNGFRKEAYDPSRDGLDLRHDHRRL